MVAICLDDERILVNFLHKIVSASPDIKTAVSFTSELDALDWAEKNPFDVAFLDIELRTMDGLEVAERLRAINPDCGIVFCTGHASYAVDAIRRLRVDGYVLKPIEAAAVQREIDRIKARYQKSRILLTIDLSGGVNVLDSLGRPVHFRRKKTEQLLAVLVEQNGLSLTTRELCELLWEDSAQNRYLYEKNENYLTQLFTDLRRTLEGCGAQEVLKKTTDGYAICMPLIALMAEDDTE